MASVSTDAAGGILVVSQNVPGVVGNVSLVPVDQSLVTAPTIGSQVYKWICGNTAVVGTSVAITTVPTKYLPGSCRG